MVGFSFGAPEDPAERDAIIQLAITLARAKFGEPTDEQVEREFIRPLIDLPKLHKCHQRKCDALSAAQIESNVPRLLA